MRYGMKTWPISGAKVIGDAEQGMVEAYCSVFNNVDYSGEVIRPGFFADTITAAATQGKTLPKILWSHNMWEQPLGKTLEAEEVLPYSSNLPPQIATLGGLRVVGQFNLETQAGKDAFSNIKFGALDKYSIGYFVLVDQYDRENQIIELLKGDWKEWSPVNFPANDATLTVDAKNGGGYNVERTEHVYVVRGPAEFEEGSFKRHIHQNNDGREYTVITGKLRATGDVSEASIRLDGSAWSASDALALCKSNARGTFEPSNVKSGDEIERLAEHGSRMVEQVSAYLDRVEQVKQRRLAENKAGRELSEANRSLLASLLPDLKSVIGKVEELLDRTAPNDTSKANNSGAMRSLLAKAQYLNAELEILGV